MQYFVIDPSCYGELGEGTIFETKNGSREVTQLDMMLERIPKDDFGIHKTQLVVSEPAMEFLKGFSIGRCEIVRSEEFPFDLSPEEEIKRLFARTDQRLKDLGLENKRGIDFLK